MTTLLCKAFRAAPLLDGRIELQIDDAQTAGPDCVDPTSTRLLRIEDVAAKLRLDRKTVERRGRQRRNPIPFVRGKGRPFILERDLFSYVSARGVGHL